VCFLRFIIHCVGCMRYHHSLLYTLVSVQTDIFLVTLRNFHYHLSLEMPVPSQCHYGFHSFPVVD
jgi:hypothetical protein